MININLVLVDEKTSRRLNKKYRQLDQVATVLSFYYGQAETPVGEIILCPQAANQQNLSLTDLINHGLSDLLSQIPTQAVRRIGFKGNWSKFIKAD